MNTLDFFETIFGDAVSEERRLSIFTLPDKKSWRFADLDAAASHATRLPSACHVYHCMSAIAGEPKGRGTVDDARAVGSLWCDIDVAGDAHKGKHLPESKDVAIRFVLDLPVPPSVIVDSGNGIHGYWPLEVPLVFESEPERAEAARVARAWHQVVCDAAKERGWILENLGDLVRVLRVPGTWNSKTDPAKPVLVVHATGEVFDLDRLVAMFPKQPKLVAPAVAAGPLSPLDRCRLYLNEVPGAIEGESGGTQTLVACKAIFRFGLTGGDVRTAFEHYNSKCLPPWTNDKEIEHKLADALKSVNAAGEFGKLLAQDCVPDPVGDIAAAAILKANGAPARDDTPRDPSGFPIDCLMAPGLIEEVIRFNLRTALYPQPELALAGALAILSVITGRKVRDPRGARTNTYVLGLAPSGGGKEHARKINKEILLRAGAEHLIGPERVASSAGLVSSVAAQPAVLFQLDEIGRLLSTMKNPAKQPHLYNIGTVLLQLYSSSDSLWIADAYADAKKTKRINQPHCCVYGTSVPGAFWDNLTTENVSEGLLGRLLTFETTMGYVPIANPKQEPVPDSILEAVRWWIDFQPGGSKLGNLNNENPTPELIGYSKEAQERMDDHLNGICARRSRESETSAAVWSRSGEKTGKLALLFACSRATPAALPRVEIDDVNRAVKIANWLTRKMLRKAFEHVAENETESRSKKVLRLITAPMTMSELTRKTQWLRSKERYEIISDLQAAGYIAMESKDTSGRPITYVKRLT